MFRKSTKSLFERHYVANATYSSHAEKSNYPPDGDQNLIERFHRIKYVKLPKIYI